MKLLDVRCSYCNAILSPEIEAATFTGARELAKDLATIHKELGECISANDNQDTKKSYHDS